MSNVHSSLRHDKKLINKYALSYIWAPLPPSEKKLVFRDSHMYIFSEAEPCRQHFINQGIIQLFDNKIIPEFCWNVNTAETQAPSQKHLNCQLLWQCASLIDIYFNLYVFRGFFSLFWQWSYLCKSVRRMSNQSAGICTFLHIPIFKSKSSWLSTTLSKDQSFPQPFCRRQKFTIANSDEFSTVYDRVS